MDSSRKENDEDDRIEEEGNLVLKIRATGASVASIANTGEPEAQDLFVAK